MAGGFVPISMVLASWRRQSFDNVRSHSEKRRSHSLRGSACACTAKGARPWAGAEHSHGVPTGAVQHLAKCHNIVNNPELDGLFKAPLKKAIRG